MICLKIDIYRIVSTIKRWRITVLGPPNQQCRASCAQVFRRVALFRHEQRASTLFSLTDSHKERETKCLIAHRWKLVANAVGEIRQWFPDSNYKQLQTITDNNRSGNISNSCFIEAVSFSFVSHKCRNCNNRNNKSICFNAQITDTLTETIGFSTATIGLYPLPPSPKKITWQC